MVVAFKAEPKIKSITTLKLCINFGYILKVYDFLKKDHKAGQLFF